MKLSPKMQFLIKNGLKGFIWLFILLTAYLLFEKIVISQKPDIWIEKFYARPGVIYFIYICSEFFFGIFPPELFMIWAVKKADPANYFFIVSFLALVSYGLGYITFLIGKYIHKKITFRYIRIRFLKKTWPQLKRYGIFIIIVAALTPIPWSASCLLVGSAGYPSLRFLKYGIVRIIRFAVYGYIVFRTHHI